MQHIFVLAIGFFFGIVLIKADVASWFRIQKMFRFEEAYMYLVIGSAVAVGALSLLVIKKLRLHTVSGEPIEPKSKPLNKGTVIGGMLFGVGWAITGACPGPIYAQMGGGEYWAAMTFVGAFIGAYLYAYLRPKLPH